MGFPLIEAIPTKATLSPECHPPLGFPVPYSSFSVQGQSTPIAVHGNFTLVLYISTTSAGGRLLLSIVTYLFW